MDLQFLSPPARSAGYPTSPFLSISHLRIPLHPPSLTSHLLPACRPRQHNRSNHPSPIRSLFLTQARSHRRFLSRAAGAGLPSPVLPVAGQCALAHVRPTAASKATAAQSRPAARGWLPPPAAVPDSPPPPESDPSPLDSALLFFICCVCLRLFFSDWDIHMLRLWKRRAQPWPRQLHRCPN